MSVQPLDIDLDLLRKYAVPGPRYTSYPTAPLFTEAFGWQEYIQALDETEVKRRPLSLYFHLPYCRSLCWYCGCNMVVTHNRDKIHTYLEYVQREICLIRERMTSEREVEQLHWGGGSPSYLSRQEKTALMSFIREQFDFAPDAEIGTELDPRDLQPGEAEILKEVGFNRISFGIQDFDPQVQQAVNRLHSEERIFTVFGQLRQAGFDSINVDLIYGLPKQSLTTFRQTIEKILRLQPDRIALFNFAYLPTLFKHQRLIKEEELPVSEEKLRILKMAIEQLTAHGYVYIGMDHFAKPDDELCLAQRNKTLYRNFQGYSTKAGCDLLAFGNSAISQLAAIYAQNHKTIPAYCAAIDAGIPATARGYRLHRDDLLRREVIKRIMCDLELYKASLEQQWQIDFDRYFAAEIEGLKPLEQDGLLILDHDGISVTNIGRLLIRNIAMVFDRYLPTQRDQRPLFSKTV